MMAEWKADSTLLTNGRIQIVGVTRAGQPLTYSDVIKLWQDDESFRDFFIAQLNNAPFKAFRWETPPITKGTADRHFEFALLQAGSSR